MAQELNPFDRLLDKASSPVGQDCVAPNCQNRLVVKQRMRNAIKSIHSLSVALRPAHDSLTATLPEQAPSRKLHIPLIAELAERFGYSEVPHPDDIVKGMPITGDIPCINALPSKVTSATAALGDVRDAISDKKDKVLKSLSKSTDFRMKQKRWGLPYEEFQKGR